MNDPAPAETPTPTPEPPPEETPTPTPGPTPFEGISDFSGVTSVDDVTDTTAMIHWDSHEDAVYYVILKKELSPIAEGNYSIVANLNADQTSYHVKGLKIDTTYSFKVRAYDDEGRVDNNNVRVTVQTSLAPPRPVSVMLKYPLVSTGFMRTPTFTVRYVKAGETVRLFTDDHCTQQVGSGIVDLDKTSIDIQTSTLTAFTSYEIYANITNIWGNTSPCSSAYASYRPIACPDNSYAKVEGSEELGTDPFCVFKTEARDNGEGVPVVTYATVPWGKISGIKAMAACKLLEVEHGTCTVMNNAQWMTIARDIEATDANWSGGEVGNGVLNRGHSDANPAEALSISDLNNPWDQTGNNSANWSQKRTFELSNGEILWDFAGNLTEWVDWVPGGSFTSGPKTCDSSSSQLLEFECAAVNPNDYLPGNPAGIDPSEYNTAYNLGRIYGTTDNSRGGATRGGWFNYGESAGIFHLNLGHTPADWFNYNGFRCVCNMD